ncbi:MAG: O-antigen ligase family protein [Candidatus Peregrinibacteria bacterium]|nr:O-antigen ligase family protein [Candidatus Peregrinibacteria bacterium]MDZ4245086.1 O-antigen ligase family protein [Candidatus Gracilibacteria bacterium]
MKKEATMLSKLKKMWHKLYNSMYHLKKELTTRRIAIFCFCLGIILSFFQINTVALQGTQWSGQFSPYTTFQFYLSDIMFSIGILFYGLYVTLNSKRIFFSIGNNHARFAIAGIFFFALLSYFFSINETITFFWLIQLFKLLIVYLFVINRLISEKRLIILILSCLVFQVFLGLLQFILQSSVGLSFLGESNIGPEILNVAKIDIGSLKVIRPYGTFTHANIFGGLLSIGVLLAGYLRMQELMPKKKANILIGILSLGVLLSFSRAAWLATIVSLIIFLAFREFKITYSKIRNFTFTFLTFIFIGYFTGILNLILVRLKLVGDTSLVERIDQIKTSFSMLLAHPMGVGLGNYTNAVADFSSKKLMPWEFEPVHNMFLLIGTELGILAAASIIAGLTIGLLHLFKLLTKIEGKYKCFPIYFAIILITHIFILANLDHYFYTNYSAGIFLMVILGVMTNYLANLEESGVSIEK